MLCNRFVYLGEFELKLRNINVVRDDVLDGHTVSISKLLSRAYRKFSEVMTVRAAHARYRVKGGPRSVTPLTKRSFGSGR